MSPATQKTTMKTPCRQDAVNIAGSWRSCKTDRDRHDFIKKLKKINPQMAERFSCLLKER